MANDMSTNPWILDTTKTAPEDPFRCTVYVDHFEWVEYTGDTDTVTIKNGAGKEIWKANGASDLQEVRSGHVGTVFGGLFVSAMTAGKIRVFLGKPA